MRKINYLKKMSVGMVMLTMILVLISVKFNEKTLQSEYIVGRNVNNNYDGIQYNSTEYKINDEIYCFVKDYYNYSVSKIMIYSCNTDKTVKKLLDTVYGQDVYIYDNYIFIEDYTGAACGAVKIYELNDDELTEIIGYEREFVCDNQVDVHEKCIEYMKKTAKEIGYEFRKFELIEW